MTIGMTMTMTMNAILPIVTCITILIIAAVVAFSETPSGLEKSKDSSRPVVIEEYKERNESVEIQLVKDNKESFLKYLKSLGPSGGTKQTRSVDFWLKYRRT